MSSYLNTKRVLFITLLVVVLYGAFVIWSKLAAEKLYGEWTNSSETTIYLSNGVSYTFSRLPWKIKDIGFDVGGFEGSYRFNPITNRLTVTKTALIEAGSNDIIEAGRDLELNYYVKFKSTDLIVVYELNTSGNKTGSSANYRRVILNSSSTPTLAATKNQVYTEPKNISPTPIVTTPPPTPTQATIEQAEPETQRASPTDSSTQSISDNDCTQEQLLIAGTGPLHCSKIAIETAELNLNQKYQSLKAELNNEQFIPLRTIQRQWIKDRKIKCSNLSEVESDYCLAREAYARTRWLEAYKP